MGWSEKVTSRAFPLVLLLIMIAIAVWIELTSMPPLRIGVKAPVLVLLIVGLGLRRIDRSEGGR